MLQVSEKKDGKPLENSMDVVEGSNGRIIIGILQSMNDVRKIQKLTFRITFTIELATILVNVYGLFAHKPYCGLITLPIVLAAYLFSKIVRKENLEFLDFLKQGFGWEDVVIHGSKATVSIRGCELLVDVVTMPGIEKDILDVAGKKLYTKEGC